MECLIQSINDVMQLNFQIILNLCAPFLLKEQWHRIGNPENTLAEFTGLVILTVVDAVIDTAWSTACFIIRTFFLMLLMPLKPWRGALAYRNFYSLETLFKNIKVIGCFVFQMIRYPFALIAGIRVYREDQKFYLPPKREYQKLNLRPKSWGSIVTDFFH